MEKIQLFRYFLNLKKALNQKTLVNFNFNLILSEIVYYVKIIHSFSNYLDDIPGPCMVSDIMNTRKVFAK